MKHALLIFDDLQMYKGGVYISEVSIYHTDICNVSPDCLSATDLVIPPFPWKTSDTLANMQAWARKRKALQMPFITSFSFDTWDISTVSCLSSSFISFQHGIEVIAHTLQQEMYMNFEMDRPQPRVERQTRYMLLGATISYLLVDLTSIPCIIYCCLHRASLRNTKHSYSGFESPVMLSRVCPETMSSV